jgi:hypothetical protein
MKVLAILGTTVAGVLLLVAADDASTLSSTAQPKKGAPTPPPIIHRSPAIGGGVRAPVVQPPVVRAPVVQPPVVKAPVVQPHVVQRAPAIVTAPRNPVIVQQPIKPIVKENVNTFVNKNVTKFVGPTGPSPRVVERPKIEIGGKGAEHVVGAYQKKFGNGPIKVGGKVVDARRRDEFVANFQKNHQERFDRRFERADLIRRDLGHHYDHLFAPHWWDHFHDVRTGWWGRWPVFASAWYDAFTLRHHWGWWRPVTWVDLSGWCAPNVWGPPLYYDYGGNVNFDNNVVYVEGSPIASQEDYAAQALALAASGAERLANSPPSADQIEQNWLPLGVFGLTNQSTGEPTAFLQLAVNKDGVIAGTYTNSVTNEALPVTGAIDPATQRAAWFIGDDRNTVFETGAYNLSQPQTQVLVHFGLTNQQTWLMIRMPEPTE